MVHYRYLPVFFLFSLSSWSAVFTPQEALKTAYLNNPELAASKASATAEKEAIPAQYSLSNPKIGFMRETDMNFMQMQDGPMNTWSVSQEFLFPTKYFARGGVQESIANRKSHDYLDTKLEIRSRTLTLYFRCYTSSKILGLLKAQKETLIEIARIAEARRAAGSVPQQDEMKAHVEQTMIENEILLASQEYAESRFAMNAVLNRPIEEDFTLPFNELKIDEDIQLEGDLDSLSSKTSHHLVGEKMFIKEAELKKDLAKMNYLPDFMLTYKRTIDYEVTGHAFGIEMTIPLWFFSRQNSELSSAVSKEVAARKNFKAHENLIESQIKSLKVKVETLAKQLEIYKTALIPQATSTLNSSRSAYSTGRVGFQDLLDAERTLYSIRIQYYKNFSKFIEAVTALERAAGRKVSNLPFLMEEK